MNRPLDGVEEKIRRARIHLESLHTEVGRVFAERPVRFATVPDSEVGYNLVPSPPSFQRRLRGWGS